MIFTSETRSPFVFYGRWQARFQTLVVLVKAIYMESNEAEAAEISLAVAMSSARSNDGLSLVNVILVFLGSTNMALECQFLGAFVVLVRKRHISFHVYLKTEDSLYTILQNKNMLNTDTIMYALFSWETLAYREEEQQNLTGRYLLVLKRALPLTSRNRDHAICENEFSFSHHLLDNLLESSFGLLACTRKPE